jgi:hypothetical protein
MEQRLGIFPYWALSFDAMGRLISPRHDVLLSEVASGTLTDMFVFAHGWNNDTREARTLTERFFREIELVLASRKVQPLVGNIGVVGVLWPSKRWADEDPAPRGGAASVRPTNSDSELVQDLKVVFPAPEQQQALDEMAHLLQEHPPNMSSLSRFQELMAIVATQPDAGDAPEDNGEAQGLLELPAERVFERFADAAPQRRSGGVALSDPFKRLWGGAKEAARQLTYWQMKRRAGLVGKIGLGPVLGELWRGQPRLRLHLAGHSFGARLVSFALAGLPDEVDRSPSPVKSMALIQAAFSHFAFAKSLPHDLARGGALAGKASRVDGPIIVTHSRHDLAVSELYARASFATRDDAAFLVNPGFRWGAMGCDGAQGVNASEVRLGPVGQTYPFGAGKFVNLNGNRVITKGKFPTGAHSDIFYPQIAWAVVAAAQIAIHAADGAPATRIER